MPVARSRNTGELMSAGVPAESTSPEVELPPSRPRRRRPLRWAVVGAAVTVLIPLLFVLGSQIGTDPRLIRSPLLGKEAPAFSLPRFDKPGTLSSSDLAGKVVRSV